MTEPSFGRYRLLAELGHGGMADVFLAVVAGPAGSGFSKLTVIKRLRANLVEDPEFVRMLVDEARIAARLNHPNVVQTNEVGQVGSQYFIAMEYLDGQPLHRLQHRATSALAKEGAEDLFAPDLQYLVVKDALAGLHHAHELADYDGTPLQIVHRDVTPQNIFVTYEGQVKVVDFGIARATGRSSETQQGIVKGKMRYMAPEQAMGLLVDRRADVFSAGIVLWEAATGRRMWKDMDELKILSSLVSGDVPISPRSVKPDVPENIDRICQKALAIKVDDRYATAWDFHNDLEQALAESGSLVEARRKLGPATATLFAKQRAELKRILETQLSELTTNSSEGPAVAIMSSPPSVSGSISGSISTSTSSRTNSSNPGSGGFDSVKDVGRETTATGMGSTAPPPVPARWGRMVGAGVLTAVVVTGGLWMFSRTRPPDAAKHETSSANVAEVRVALVASPPTARILIDGRDVGNPYKGAIAKDGATHRVTVEAEGFRSQEVVVGFDGDLNRDFRLEPLPAGGALLGSTSPGGPVTARTTPPRGGGKVLPPASPGARPTPPSTPAPVVEVPSPPPGAPPAPAPATSGRKKREIDKNNPWEEPPN